MTERYDRAAASHYAAFRPPLHGLILERMVRPGERFRVGLDAGCGTGCSAIALTRCCDRVLGIEPSRSMLEAARSHPGVTYFHGRADALSQLPFQEFDVVTFAGSMSYARTEQLRRELVRVCPPGGTILVYDFEVLLDEITRQLGVEGPGGASGYDYYAGLAGWAEFEVDVRGTERVQLEVSGCELAHLLLSDSNRHDAVSRQFPGGEPFETLTSRLGNAPGGIALQANLYFTRWRVLGR